MKGLRSKTGWRQWLSREHLRQMRSRATVALFAAPSQEQGDRLRTILERLILLRVLILTGFLGTSAWRLLVSGAQYENIYPVFILVGATFGISALNALLLRHAKRLVAFGYTQLLVDLALVTLAAYVSQSLISNLLFLLVILGAALLFHRHGAVILAALSGIAYTLLDASITSGTGSGSYLMNPNEVFLAYVSFIIIALVAASLTEQVQTLGKLADSHAKNLNELTKKQELMFNDISEGIITLDMDEMITGINQAARAILGLAQIPDENLLGRHFTTIFKELGVDGAGQILEQEHKGGAGEFSSETNQEGQGLHLNYLVRKVHSNDGSDLGKLVIFNDVSRVRSIEQRLELHERMTELLAAESNPIGAAVSIGSDISMIGESPIMKQVFTLVERVAQSEASVLITGESGTGKELIARAIHHRSDRKQKPFVAINCGAIPENLIESELFGHKKGSFTGAVNDNLGLFRQANGGSIFLDEIGELPLPMQTKLLRVLQERKVRPVGDVHDFPVDVRVIAATNRDLKREIGKASFREDLFYRLNVVNIVVPPLRDRREDIPLLVRHFIGRYCDQDSVLPRVSPEAIQLLSNYGFPGNIRELENVIERALVLGGQAILPEHLPEEVRISHKSERSSGDPSRTGETQILLLPVDLDSELSKLERELLVKALEQTNGLKKQAAELLGLNFRSLRYRLKKYGLGDGSPNDDMEERDSSN